MGEIWARCESFGYKAKLLRQVMLDSRLASLQAASFENLEMFHDQQALCDWMHDIVAMHPFTTPSEMERETVPVPGIIRTLLAKPFNETVADVAQKTGASMPRQLNDRRGKEQYDAMKAGKASGFDITWNGMTSSPASTVKVQWWSPALLLCVEFLRW